MQWLYKLSSLAMDRMPKKISPGAHVAIDYGMAALTAGYAIRCLPRNKAAALAGFMLSMAEVTNAATVDAPGGVCKMVSMPLHGRMDLGIAALLAALPGFLGFANEPEGRFFYASAAAGTLVASLTDYTGTGERAQSKALLAAGQPSW